MGRDHVAKPGFLPFDRRSWPALVGVTVIFIVILAAIFALRPALVRSGGEVFASLGTGELDGIYYPVGKAICKIANRDLPITGVRCSPETTPGSVYNVNAVRSGELEFAIVQSDVQFDAYTSEGAWHGHPFRGLRSVMSLYPELVTIMVRSASHIYNIAGLAGRRVDVGSRGSGTRATWDAIEAALGWRGAQRVHPLELRMDLAKSALCSGAIDATLMILGHPSPLVREQQAACPVNFVAVDGPAIDKLVHDHPYYLRGTIGGAAYGDTAAVPTFGVRATLVTSASVDVRVVAVIAKELLTHVAELRMLHPALAGLRAEEMTGDELTAPLHPGAAQAYRELGLLNKRSESALLLPGQWRIQ
jgi:uncharacterized protein